MKRAKRVQMTSRQLLTKNASEALVNKNNHLLDPLKQILGTVRNPTAIPSEEIIAGQIEGLDMFTGPMRGRFLMSAEALGGKLNLDGTLKKPKSPLRIDMRKGPGCLQRPR